jgi:lipid-A-disaccharide synthase
MRFSLRTITSGDPLTFLLGRLLVKIPFITIVNLITHRVVYEEFLQGDVRAEKLGPAVERLLPGGSRRADVAAGMADAVQAVSGRDSATANAARAALDVIGA